MGGSSPCASCKLLRRRCAKDCIFAPYFPSDDPHKFAIVHKVFASNVSKMLQSNVVCAKSMMSMSCQPIFCFDLFSSFEYLTGASHSSEDAEQTQELETLFTGVFWGYILPTESSLTIANAARSGSGRDTLHPDAARAKLTNPDRTR
ncbi:LOB domain-containing protein 12 [Morella rubra]|uniref:LOB domain-containing protein 12 n=1 Tax=Morella rubra TaxID=262757 RepID=A0A6A1UQ06_9ROSI|nr:LOB domain-containing protein 12 [Morella rubra]